MPLTANRSLHKIFLVPQYNYAMLYITVNHLNVAVKLCSFEQVYLIKYSSYQIRDLNSLFKNIAL